MKASRVIVGLLLSAAFCAQAQVGGTTSRLVVRMASTSPANKLEQAAAVARTVSASVSGQSTSGAIIVNLGKAMTQAEAADKARVLRADPRVLSAEPDVWVKPAAAVPSDPYLSMQWGLAGGAGGADFSSIWSRTQGAGALVAVLDTGITPHPELAGHIVGGYDFVSDVTAGGDSDGRDADPTDPGNFCEVNGSRFADSDWHGTAVAGVIAATSDNVGITGGAPSAKLLNVRVLGRCGGWLSDVADGIRWSAGLAVSGVPAHGQGVPVLNLSLAAEGIATCPAFLQDAISEARAAGAVLVVSVGNAGENAVPAPASCAGVISVAAHTSNGDLASYSNYSSSVTISAPAGGACRNASGCVSATALSVGVTGNNETPLFGGPRYWSGTSIAAPYVAAGLAVLRALEPSLTPDQLTSFVVNSAKAFPSSSFCYGNTQCGFGMLNVKGAVAQLDAYFQPAASVTASASNVLATNVFTLNAAATSAHGSSAYTYSWLQTAGPSARIVANGASATVTAPDARGVMTFRVTVADAALRTAFATVSVAVTNNKAPTIPAQTLASGVEGTVWSVTPVVNDVDGNYNRLVLISGPDGMSVAGKVLTWASPVAGTHEVQVQAVDADGAESIVTPLTLTVTTPPAPVVSPPAPTTTVTPPATSASSVSVTPPVATQTGGAAGGGAMGLFGALLLAMTCAGKAFAARRK